MRPANKSIYSKRSNGHFTAKAMIRLPQRAFVEVLIKLNKDKSAVYFSKKGKFAHNLKKAKLNEYSDLEMIKYTEVTNKTVLWHGTGRYQYSESGTIDVFKSILGHGSIKPAEDFYGLLVGAGKTYSISTTTSRIIARSYSDTHGLGADEKLRYGSAIDWVSYYYGMFYLELFTKKGITVITNWKNWSNNSKDSNKEVKWGKKVNRNASYVWDVFETGSDISGNYPIIFGIKDYETKIRLPDLASKAEVRLGSNLSLHNVSHIEVPEDKMTEVNQILSEYDHAIPVFPIELGEYVASKRPTLELLRIDRQA